MFSTLESRTLVSVFTNTLKQEYRSGLLRLVWKPGETSPACQIVLPAWDRERGADPEGGSQLTCGWKHWSMNLYLCYSTCVNPDLNIYIYICTYYNHYIPRIVACIYLVFSSSKFSCIFFLKTKQMCNMFSFLIFFNYESCDWPLFRWAQFRVANIVW